MSPQNLPRRLRRPAAPALLALGAIACALAALLPGASPARAASSQNLADMVIINPGGGRLGNGSDGLLSVFNGESAFNTNFFAGAKRFSTATGSDQQIFAGKSQWFGTGTSPTLFAGSPLAPNPSSWPNPARTIGEAGAARASTPFFLSWSATTGTGTPSTGSVQIVSTSGAIVRIPAGQASTAANFPASAPTGSGSAVIRYTGIVNNLAYVIDRAISYTYPDNFYTETYTFTVPTGNVDPVQFYLGGDAAPGEQDQGSRGAMTTSPNRVLYEINATSGIYVAYGEVGSPATSPFSSGWVGPFSGPYTAIAKGNTLVQGSGVCPTTIIDTSFCIDTLSAGHDAGLDIQWTLPSTPGTYTRQMRTIVGLQGQSIAARFTPSSITAGQTTALEIEVVNTAFSTVSGVGFSLALPAGLSVSGAATNGCNGTVTAASSATSISLSGGSLPSGGNCQVSVPLGASDGAYTVNDQGFQNLTPGTLTKGFGVSTLTVTGNPAPTPAPTPVPTPSTAPTPSPTPVTPSSPPSLAVSLLPSRRSLRAGQAMTLGVRTSNGAAASTAMARMRGQMAIATAEGVRTCVRLPANLVLTRRPSGSARSGRTVCWSSGDIPAGQQRTAVLGVRGVAVRAVSRTISASARSTAGSQASARATAKAGVRITPRAPRPVVTG